ncbi:TPA: fimbrial biogenesis chaperone [Serratia fonticola]|uniref:Chaperone protein focC n=1 Tax=Serratia fonticola TaxID=47917 RepID=A0A448S9Q6_SERFO|nr:fimbria/pilus periplasmic chaperone [Serratia fonticola]CAI1025401.1 Chaperone protein focC precursor [Serratia fonticola]CAI1814034.1 Chaperone protein focC precursor [Serratia fonticola]CAI2530624.1 Chaperone protein focC precursor [Serratia fonticola]VEI64423.1 Chaperone protein focC precursor [Serratia fonticola]
MIKFLLCLFVFIIIPCSCLAGVSVVGTRFFIDDATKALNVKLLNDNASDYLVKTKVSNDGFIISPPLFILPKNKSNIITIIPDEKIKGDKDGVYSLIITTIPKSEVNPNDNVVSLAIRSHFNLIYKHGAPTEKDYNEMTLTRSQVGKWSLVNPTNFAFMILLSNRFSHHSGGAKLLGPGQSISVDEHCSKDSCSLWLYILDDESHIVKKLNLMHD